MASNLDIISGVADAYSESRRSSEEGLEEEQEYWLAAVQEIAEGLERSYGFIPESGPDLHLVDNIGVSYADRGAKGIPVVGGACYRYSVSVGERPIPCLCQIEVHTKHECLGHVHKEYRRVCQLEARMFVDGAQVGEVFDSHLFRDRTALGRFAVELKKKLSA